MRYMASYDFMETMRTTSQWMGATAQALGSYPAFSMIPHPGMEWMRAWGEVTERSFQRMVVKPDWGIPSVTGEDGRDHPVSANVVVPGAFGDLIHMNAAGRKDRTRQVLLIAPMSGHYATLLRSTVMSLLPDCEVYVTDWHNARDIPVSAGKFDVEDYTLYLVDYMRYLGPETHVIAVCQPAPLALAATAYLAEEDPKAQPRSLTLIGGPIDPDANATDVTDFGRRVTMGQLEKTMIQRVGFKYPGVGRKVYPGLLQLASFVSMNGETHADAFQNQISAVAKGDASDHDKHNSFYDEYLAVMDMTAEFYLSTVDRIFKNGEIARNAFTVAGKPVDIGKITTVAVKTVEGSNDDISAPGQCIAALDLCTGLPDDKKASHLEDGAGHYGIFAGRSWRNNIRPLVLAFIDANANDSAPAKPAAPAAAANVAAEPAKSTKKKASVKKAAKAKPAKTPAAKIDVKKADVKKADAKKADADKVTPEKVALKPTVIKKPAAKTAAAPQSAAKAKAKAAKKSAPQKTAAEKSKDTSVISKKPAVKKAANKNTAA